MVILMIITSHQDADTPLLESESFLDDLDDWVED